MKIKIGQLMVLSVLMLSGCTRSEPKPTPEQLSIEDSRRYCISSLAQAGEGMMKTADTCQQQYPDLPAEKRW